MRRRLLFVHASPAALAPVTGFFAGAAPELALTSLLDDGLLGLLAAGDDGAVEERLAALVEGAAAAYAPAAALLTCSAVSAPALRGLRRRAPIPILKVDEAMARAAVRLGRRLGVVMTFEPTVAATRALLREAAAEAGRDVTLLEEVRPAAHRALLAGDLDGHDREIAAAARALAAAGAEAVVLAQVSMERVRAALAATLPVPVLSALPASLADVRRALAAAEPAA